MVPRSCVLAVTGEGLKTFSPRATPAKASSSRGVSGRRWALLLLSGPVKAADYILRLARPVCSSVPGVSHLRPGARNSLLPAAPGHLSGIMCLCLLTVYGQTCQLSILHALKNSAHSWAGQRPLGPLAIDL